MADESATGGAVKLHIRQLGEAGVKELTLPASDVDVSELQAAIARETGVPPDRQRLIFHGKVLRPGRTVAAYGVGDAATLHLVDTGGAGDAPIGREPQGRDAAPQEAAARDPASHDGTAPATTTTSAFASSEDPAPPSGTGAARAATGYDDYGRPIGGSAGAAPGSTWQAVHLPGGGVVYGGGSLDMLSMLQGVFNGQGAAGGAAADAPEAGAPAGNPLGSLAGILSAAASQQFAAAAANAQRGGGGGSSAPVSSTVTATHAADSGAHAAPSAPASTPVATSPSPAASAPTSPSATVPAVAATADAGGGAGAVVDAAQRARSMLLLGRNVASTARGVPTVALEPPSEVGYAPSEVARSLRAMVSAFGSLTPVLLTLADALDEEHRINEHGRPHVQRMATEAAGPLNNFSAMATGIAAMVSGLNMGSHAGDISIAPQDAMLMRTIRISRERPYHRARGGAGGGSGGRGHGASAAGGTTTTDHNDGPGDGGSVD